MFVVRGIEMPYIAMIAVATRICSIMYSYYYSAAFFSLQDLAYDEQVRVCGKPCILTSQL